MFKLYQDLIAGFTVSYLQGSHVKNLLFLFNKVNFVLQYKYLQYQSNPAQHRQF